MLIMMVTMKKTEELMVISKVIVVAWITLPY